MQSFLVLTRLAPDAINSFRAPEELERKAVNAVKANAVTGPHDHIDIFEAPDLAAAAQVSALNRTFWGAHTEIWAAHR